MQTDKKGVSGADTAENETQSYSEVELEGNEVNPWPYLCSMQCKLCLPRETKLAAYKISTSTLRKHIEDVHPNITRDYTSSSLDPASLVKTSYDANDHKDFR